jgi:hypothetical protein
MSDPFTHDDRTALLARIDASYTALTRYLDTCAEPDLTTPADSAGFTAKDHLIHLAVWGGSMIAVIDRQPRWEAMGLTLETWRTIVRGYDQINAAILRQHREKTLTAARAFLHDAHTGLINRVSALTPDALQLPYSHYQPESIDETYPLWMYIEGNTADHYDEHREYIAAILSQPPT